MPHGCQGAWERALCRGTQEECLRDSVFYEESDGGVTLSGGGVPSVPGFAEEFLQYCKERGMRMAAIETTLAVPLADAERSTLPAATFLSTSRLPTGSGAWRLRHDPDVRDKNLRRIIGLGAVVVGTYADNSLASPTAVATSPRMWRAWLSWHNASTCFRSTS